MDIRELLKILKSGWIVVVLVISLAIGADMVYLINSPEKFRTSSTVSLDLQNNQEVSHAEQKALERTVRRIVVSFEKDEPLAKIAGRFDAIELTRTSGAPFEFRGSFGRMDLSVEMPKNTGVMELTATAPSGELATALAAESAEAIQKEAIDTLSTLGDQSPAIKSVRITGVAIPHKVEPTYLLNLGLSALCGAFIGAGIAYIRYMLLRKRHN